jgi:4-alpha-glucanotransferase
MTEPVNVPGTHHEYPNWQRKLSRDLEDLEIREDFDRRFAEIGLAREAPLARG